MDWHGCRLCESFILCLHNFLSHERDFFVFTQERRRSHAQLRGVVETEQDRIGSNRKRRRGSRGSTDGPRAHGKHRRLDRRVRSAFATRSDEYSVAEKEGEQEQEDALAKESQEEDDAEDDGSGDELEYEDQ